VGGVPQYAAGAESILLTLHHPALEGAMSLNIRYERFNEAKIVWERVMPTHAEQHLMYTVDQEIEPYPSDTYTYSVRIGDPLYEAPHGAGHYRAVVTIQTNDRSASQVINTEAILLFDLVDLD